jgi:hypothetical protein
MIVSWGTVVTGAALIAMSSVYLALGVAMW